ncbi:hypothetical protein GCM10027168_41460 [Streptomyces capparidis]
MSTFDFPADLVQAQRELEQAQADLSALYARLPRFPEPVSEPYTDARGIQHPPSPGWSEEEHRAVADLLKRQQHLAETIATHFFWQTLEGPAFVEARSALKRATGTTTAGT